MHRLIVACSGKADDTNVDPASHGTWVLGDTGSSIGPPPSLVAPKVFSGFGVYNCTTGKELGDGDPLVGNAIAEADPADLCWGKVMETDHTPQT
jgi:hypothetical protein